MSDPIVIAGAKRTPMGGFQGEFSTLTASELGGAAIKAAITIGTDIQFLQFGKTNL